MKFDLSRSESAGSRSLHRLVRRELVISMEKAKGRQVE
jgi:hypothetical protein